MNGTMANEPIPHSKSPRNGLEADYVRSILEYDPATGEFRWRPRLRGQFATERTFGMWNTRYAGALAGCSCRNGYRTIRINDRLYLAHRLVWLHVTGVWPAAEIDHINGNPGDNRLANLREATHAENLQNTKLQRTNTSGFKGAHWNTRDGKWYAQITADGRWRFLGYFSTPEAAHPAYCAAAREHHGEFARFE